MFAPFYLYMVAGLGARIYLDMCFGLTSGAHLQWNK
jgi:hypothetical protein